MLYIVVLSGTQAVAPHAPIPIDEKGCIILRANRHRVLLLGGTGDAYALAERLAGRSDLACVTSLAGRSLNPRLPAGSVRIGGFGGVAGLTTYLETTGVTAVIDATHPFARQMGWHAADAARAAGVPILRLERPGFAPMAGACWHRVPDMAAAAAHAAAMGGRIFLTVGRQELAPFADAAAHLAVPPWFLIRTLDPPDPMPPFATYHLIVARGPFTEEAERALWCQHGITALVTKDSGGSMTEAKLAVAHAHASPVILIDRPPRPNVPVVADVAGAMAWIETMLG